MFSIEHAKAPRWKAKEVRSTSGVNGPDRMSDGPAREVRLGASCLVATCRKYGTMLAT